jgi:hypothetical protein
MHALVLERPGDPFKLTEVPLPTAAAGQVLVRIKASGVNPLDTKILAVKTYTGHVVSCLGWVVHKLAPLSFRGGYVFRRLHPAALADREGKSTSRRHFARGNAARRGRQANTLAELGEVHARDSS